MTRARRSSIELRNLIISAAEDAFAREGYGAVSLKDIAEEAGVTESVLYRHFPSKAALFRESVLLPLMNVLRAFADASSRYLDHPLDDRTLMRLFVGELLDQLSEHRAALRSITAAEDDLDPADLEAFHKAMAELLTNIDAIGRAEGKRRGRGQPGLGIELTNRLAIGMIISIVVHQDWLLRGLPQHPTRAQTLDHITDLLLAGVGANLD